jgi:hypothetical protein
VIAYWSLGNLDITIGRSHTPAVMGWSREVRFNLYDGLSFKWFMHACMEGTFDKHRR